MIGWSPELRELTELALARFSDLTQSELELLVAATMGWETSRGYLTDDNYSDPAFDESWHTDRVIRAELIRWLCVSRDAAKLIDPRGLHINAACISGRLELSFAKIGFPLLFANCRITDPVHLSFACVDALTIDGCATPGIDADGLVVRGNLNLRNGFFVEGVRMCGADVGSLECSGGRFASQCRPALDVSGAKVKGDVFLGDGFSAKGEVRLLGADIGGNLDCRSGRFANKHQPTLNVDGCKVRGSVYLRDEFYAEGGVSLVGAEVGGQLDCSRGKFTNQKGPALVADGAELSQVFFCDAFSAEGEVLLGV